MNIYNYIFNFINIMSIQHFLQQYTRTSYTVSIFIIGLKKRWQSKLQYYYNTNNNVNNNAYIMRG